MSDNTERQRLEGIERYPEPALCDWCGRVHAGDAFNCYHDEEPETQVDEHPVCDLVIEAVKQITNLVKENSMLPSAGGNSGGSGQRRSGGASNRLRAEDLTKDPREAKILAVKAEEQGKFGRPQVIVKLTASWASGAGIKFWYLDIEKNPNYGLLVKKFGQDETEWIDQRILLGLEQDSFHDNWYPRVSFPSSKARNS